MGSRSVKGEEFGSDDAEYTITIQYCGGWDYKPYAVGIKEEVDRLHKGKFRFILYKDSKRTGNLEVNINRTAAPESKKLVHSKRNGQGYPAQNWNNFAKSLNKAMKSLKWNVCQANQNLMTSITIWWQSMSDIKHAW